MKKKLICVALSSAMAVSSVGFVYADNNTTSIVEEMPKKVDATADATIDNKEADTNQCGENVTYTIDSDGVLTISGTGDMYNYKNSYNERSPFYSQKSKIKKIVIEDGVTSIGDAAFYSFYYTGEIVIPSSVTSIGTNAFASCTGLTSITIPNSVTSIGDSAFSSCIGLKSITLSDSITSIGANVFKNCSVLESIDIPNSITSIGANAFTNCSALTSVTIPNGVTSIGNSAFSLCTGLTSITIPDGITSIEASTFASCTGLTSVTIPSSVTSVGSSAFKNCSNLTSVTIPRGVTSIGDSAFSGCKSLESVNVDMDNANYSSVDGVLYNKAQTEILYIPEGKTSLTISKEIASVSTSLLEECNSLESIDADADNANYSSESGVLYNKAKTEIIYCPKAIKSVVLADGLEQIPNKAFQKRTELTSVVIPDSVTKIGEYAFDGCSSLTSITIPNSVTVIPSQCFRGCSSLVNVEIPDSVTSIAYGAFQNCTGLTSIEIPDSVTDFGTYVFAGCTNLVTLTLPKNLKSLGGHTFEKCSNLNSIEIPGGITKLDSNLFAECTSLTKVTLPDTITEVGNYVFENCTSLESIDLPANLVTIGDGGFGGCSNLKDIKIPNTVTTVQGGAFKGCSSLTSIVIPDGVQRIYGNTFNNCTSLTSIILPDNMLSIVSAFQNCTSLKQIKLPSGITSISSSLFSGCSSLESITIPNGVTTVQTGAFTNCNNLKSLTIPESVVNINANAFKNCTAKTLKVYCVKDSAADKYTSYPSGTEKIYKVSDDASITVKTADGIAVAGKKISLTQYVGLKPVCYVAVTDSDGVASFPGLAYNTYKLAISGYKSATTSFSPTEGNNTLVIGDAVAMDYQELPTGASNDNLYVGYAPNDIVTVTYNSVQDAVDAANDGQTIYVAAGTYNEMVTINKNIKIVGNSADDTIITYNDSQMGNDGYAPGVVEATKFHGDTVVINSSVNVEFENIQIKNTAEDDLAVSKIATALSVYGDGLQATVKLTNCTIRATRGTIFTGNMSADNTWTMDNCTIEGFQDVVCGTGTVTLNDCVWGINKNSVARLLVPNASSTVFTKMVANNLTINDITPKGYSTSAYLGRAWGAKDRSLDTTQVIVNGYTDNTHHIYKASGYNGFDKYILSDNGATISTSNGTTIEDVNWLVREKNNENYYTTNKNINKVAIDTLQPSVTKDEEGDYLFAGVVNSGLARDSKVSYIGFAVFNADGTFVGNTKNDTVYHKTGDDENTLYSVNYFKNMPEAGCIVKGFVQYDGVNITNDVSDTAVSPVTE